MATNLAIDDRLIVDAQRAGKHATKKAAVTAALQEYIARRRQLRVERLFGKIRFDPRFDYKKARFR